MSAPSAKTVVRASVQGRDGFRPLGRRSDLKMEMGFTPLSSETWNEEDSKNRIVALFGPILKRSELETAGYTRKKASHANRVRIEIAVVPTISPAASSASPCISRAMM